MFDNTKLDVLDHFYNNNILNITHCTCMTTYILQIIAIYGINTCDGSFKGRFIQWKHFSCWNIVEIDHSIHREFAAHDLQCDVT